jgi:predicted RNA polymerase sigma factor
VTSSSFDAHSAHLLRELAPQVLGAVIRRFRDLASAEDAVQEALLAASIQHDRTAASRTTNLPERNYLLTQAARLRESTTNTASEQHQ